MTLTVDFTIYRWTFWDLNLEMPIFKPQKQICSATILLTYAKSENVESCFDANSLKLDISWLEDKNKAAGSWGNRVAPTNSLTWELHHKGLENLKQAKKKWSQSKETKEELFTFLRKQKKNRRRAQSFFFTPGLKYLNDFWSRYPLSTTTQGDPRHMESSLCLDDRPYFR